MTLALLTYILSFRISIILFTSSTPLSLGVWIFLLAILLAALTRLLTFSWLRFLLFLIFIGGLLVIFSYFVAIQPNQQLKITKLPITVIALILIVSLQEKNIIINPSTIIAEPTPSIIILYSPHLIPLLLILALILLLALIIVVKVSQINRGPLRPFKYV